MRRTPSGPDIRNTRLTQGSPRLTIDMATTTTTANPQAAPQSAQPGPLKRILLIVLIAILAAGAAGGGVWFFMSRHAASAPAAASAPPPPPAVPVYYALEPMTVNLQSDDGETHYLRVGLTLKLDSQATQDALVARMPEIRSRVLLALSNKHPSDLAPLEGKRALAAELARLIAQPSDPRGTPARVEDVLFTEFVVQ